MHLEVKYKCITNKRDITGTSQERELCQKTVGEGKAVISDFWALEGTLSANRNAKKKKKKNKKPPVYS
jgi:hypothetical protein